MEKEILRFEFRDTETAGKDLMNIARDLLLIMNDANLSSPSRVEVVELGSKPISGFLDPIIFSFANETIKNNEQGFTLTTENDDFVVSISPVAREFVFLLRISLSPDDHKLVETLRELFYKVCVLLDPQIGRSYAGSANLRIREKYFEWESRTGYFTFFGWLTYFGKQELHRQGGGKVLQNPYIKAEYLGKGVLIQVGESPLDAHTPEGEELIVKATRALPPVVKD